MPAATRRVIVQIERAGATLTMADAQSLLEGSGIELDPGYGPVCVNPAAGRYVVRGQASPQAEANLRAIEGVSLFADAPVKPAVDRAAGKSPHRR